MLRMLRDVLTMSSDLTLAVALAGFGTYCAAAMYVLRRMVSR